MDSAVTTIYDRAKSHYTTSFWAEIGNPLDSTHSVDLNKV